MSTDFTATSISSGVASQTTMNAEWAAIQLALERCMNLYGDSTNGVNTLQVDMDFNSQDILNGGTGNFANIVVGGTDLAAQIAAAAASAAAALVSENNASTSETNAAASAVAAAASAAIFPTITGGDAGKFIAVNVGETGYELSVVDALPDQATHAGEYLTTNGTVASWAAVAAGEWTALGSDIHFATGNVSIGKSTFENYTTVPSILQLGAATVFSTGKASSGFLDILHNAYYDASTFTYKHIETGAASYYYQGGGTHYFYGKASAAAGFNIAWVEGLHIAVDGKVRANSGISNGTQPTLEITNVSYGFSTNANYLMYWANLGHQFDGPLMIEEQTSANTNIAAYGQLWIKDDAPNTLYFSDDAGTDYKIAGSDVGYWVKNGDTIRTTTATTIGLGIGVSLVEAWDVSYTALQVGGTAAMFTQTASGTSKSLYLAQNVYFNGTFKRISADEAGAYLQASGTHQFYVAGSAAADSSIGFTEAMKLDNDGYMFLQSGVLKIKELAAAVADTAAYGQVWVKSDAPNTLYFTDDTGVDIQLGRVIQVVNTTDSAAATGTTVMVDDNTIPQNTEGDEFMSVTITPKYSTSLLKIEVSAQLACNNSGNQLSALFQDSVADAIAAIHIYQATGNGGVRHTFDHFMTAGTTSAITFKFRAGLDRANTTTFNGLFGTALLGGVSASSITVTEIAA